MARMVMDAYILLFGPAPLDKAVVIVSEHCSPRRFLSKLLVRTRIKRGDGRQFRYQAVLNDMRLSYFCPP